MSSNTLKLEKNQFNQDCDSVSSDFSTFSNYDDLLNHAVSLEARLFEMETAASSYKRQLMQTHVEAQRVKNNLKLFKDKIQKNNPSSNRDELFPQITNSVERMIEVLSESEIEWYFNK